MNKDELLAQLCANLQASAQEARRAMEAAATEAREGATPAEKREDSRVALEQSGLARGQKERLGRVLADLAALEGFCPKQKKNNGRVELGDVVEVESEDDCGRTFFLAPVGAGIELTGPGGDGYLSVVTPSSPLGRAVLGRKVGESVEITIAGQSREWTVSFVG